MDWEARKRRYWTLRWVETKLAQLFPGEESRACALRIFEPARAEHRAIFERDPSARVEMAVLRQSEGSIPLLEEAWKLAMDGDGVLAWMRVHMLPTPTGIRRKWLEYREYRDYVRWARRGASGRR